MRLEGFRRWRHREGVACASQERFVLDAWIDAPQGTASSLVRRNTKASYRTCGWPPARTDAPAPHLSLGRRRDQVLRQCALHVSLLEHRVTTDRHADQALVLFVAQRHHRVEPRRAPGRRERRDQRHNNH